MSEQTMTDNISMPLRPKARVLKTLGEELISSETVALIELVKNAYDADAQNVLIRFAGNLKQGDGSAIVLDDGHGMDMDIIRDSWMIIAASTKRTKHRSKSGKRRVVGEKGIGRFAASRIASELELITRIPDRNSEIFAIFDWTQFDNDDLFLDEVEFLAEEREATEITPGWQLSEYGGKASGLHGTMLRMNYLKRSWERYHFDELQRGLSRLISPFQTQADFNVYVELPEGYGEIKTKVEPPELIKYPHYSVRGNLYADSKFDFTVTVETQSHPQTFNGHFYTRLRDGEWEVVKTDLAPSDVENRSYRELQCGPLSFEFMIWDRDELENVNQKIGSGLRSIRRDLDAIAGINIYRDGFRVLPYGEPDNDWLRLDLRRVQNPTRRISNNQVTGYVAITADENPNLHDQSNREGLDANTALADLEGVLKLVLHELETIRWKARHTKKETRTRETENAGLFTQPNFESIKESIQDTTTSPEDAIKKVEDAESDWKEQIRKFQDVLAQYHSLATLGGIVDKVLHDGRQPLSSIQASAGLGKENSKNLIALLKDGGDVKTKDVEAVYKAFKKIVDQATILRDVFRRVEPFGGRKKGRPKRYYIEDIIKDTFDNYRKELKENNIKVYLPTSQTLVSIDITELAEIVTNLLTNSIYWLQTVDKNKRSVRVMVSRKEESALEIIFSDTGPGIDRKHMEHIFEPYFTTKPDGQGLGLCLVGEIVKDYYNGDVELLEADDEWGAIFRLIIRKRV